MLGGTQGSVVPPKKQSDPRLRRRQYAPHAAGIEATLAQSVRSCDVRRSRYVGQERTHLQHLMTAAAMNVVRMLHWLAEVPKAKTRPSAFARLYPATA